MRNLKKIAAATVVAITIMCNSMTVAASEGEELNVAPEIEYSFDDAKWVEIYQVEVPEETAAIAEYYGGMYGIDPEFIEACAFAESTFRANATNGSCVGEWQVNPDIHGDIIELKGITDIMDPWANCNVACRIFYKHIYEDGMSYEKALMCYNGDYAGLRKLASDPNYVSDYVKKVMHITRGLKAKHAMPNDADEV